MAKSGAPTSSRATPKPPSKSSSVLTSPASPKLGPPLAQFEQDAWIAVAQTVPSARKGGTQGPLTGCQLYTQINCINLLCGNGLVRFPPPKPTVPPIVATAFNITNAAGLVALTLATIGQPTQADPWIVRASPPQSSGYNKCDDIRLLGVAPAPKNDLCDISALYTAKYNAPPPAGSKIWVSISATHAGWEDLPSTFMFQVPSPT